MEIVLTFSDDITNYSDLFRAFENNMQIFSDAFLGYFENVNLPKGII